MKFVVFQCVQPFHSSHIYLNVVFRLDRFRQVFKLPDVGARDFDLALQMSKDNYRAGKFLLSLIGERRVDIHHAAANQKSNVEEGVK